MMEMETGEFHSNGGLTFKRLDDGAVRVRVYSVPPVGAQPKTDITLSPDAWASAVAHVSNQGDTADNWQRARDFHDAIKGAKDD